MSRRGDHTLSQGDDDRYGSDFGFDGVDITALMSEVENLRRRGLASGAWMPGRMVEVELPADDIDAGRADAMIAARDAKRQPTTPEPEL
jgi:hypothetical protein